jgi:transposase-like protein
MAVSFKGVHFPKEIILLGVRWYVAYPLSTRHVEELMEERGVEVDHSTFSGVAGLCGGVRPGRQSPGPDS